MAETTTEMVARIRVAMQPADAAAPPTLAAVLDAMKRDQALLRDALATAGRQIEALGVETAELRAGLALAVWQRGERGEVGPQGQRGEQGPRGRDGAEGPRGVSGPMGERGFRGSEGPVGGTGPQGAPGPAGPAGPVGLSVEGPKGSTGATGARGPRGLVPVKQPASPRAASVTHSSTALPSKIACPECGMEYDLSAALGKNFGKASDVTMVCDECGIHFDVTANGVTIR